jgi:hypothetical protein
MGLCTTYVTTVVFLCIDSPFTAASTGVLAVMGACRGLFSSCMGFILQQRSSSTYHQQH